MPMKRESRNFSSGKFKKNCVVKMLYSQDYALSEKIYENNRIMIYRGYSQQENIPFTIKLLKKEAATPFGISRLIYEFEITREIEIESVIKPIRLQQTTDSFVLLLEDIKGISLEEYAKNNPVDIPTFLDIAIKLAEALGELHQNSIIHRDLKMAGIFIHPPTRKIKIIDLSEAVFFHAKKPGVFPEAPGHMALEQPVGAEDISGIRNDCYSLGVIFYEMLTGGTVNPLHAHTPLDPELLHKNNPDIPQPLSAIIMKLLSTSPDEGYQGAYGLLKDLEECNRQLKMSGKIEPFPLGQMDISPVLKLPQRLYGRQREEEILKTSFYHICTGYRGIVLVSGYSGVGKTVLINEVLKPLAIERGFFTYGKFDELHQNIPYSPIVSALKNIIKQLMTESRENLYAWKRKILRSVGKNGAVVTSLIPELEIIIGQQQPVEALQPKEAQNRFFTVFGNFIKVFAAKEHPMVIFLDDLQWADLPSLQLIKYLCGETKLKHFLFVGAYRDNEVAPGHPLAAAIEEIKKEDMLIKEISLAPLDYTDVKKYTAETLHCPEIKAAALAETLYRRTYGIPFFLGQLIKSVYEEKLILFNMKEGCWKWDLESINRLKMPDDVVELITAKLQKLPEKTLWALKIAACIGNTFDLKTLSIACEKEKAETVTLLLPALKEGFVLPVSPNGAFPNRSESKNPFISHNAAVNADVGADADAGAVAYAGAAAGLGADTDTDAGVDAASNAGADTASETAAHTVTDGGANITYEFLHDTVRQAAYSLFLEEEKKKAHVKVGRLILKNIGKAGMLDDKILSILDHINRGLDLIDDKDERLNLAAYNLEGGRKAKANAAYDSAINYFRAGTTLLPHDSWTVCYRLCYDLHLERAQCEYLVGNTETAELLFNIIMRHAETELEKSDIYGLKMVLYAGTGKYGEAVQIGINALASLGMKLPANPGTIHMLKELLTYKWLMRNKKAKDLARLPEMKHPVQKKIAELLINLIYVTSTSHPDLFAFSIIKAGNLAVKHGNTEMASIGYIGYSITEGSVLGNYKGGYELGEVATKLVESCGKSISKSVVYFPFGALICHWWRHGKEGLHFLHKALQYAVEAGNVLIAGYSYGTILENRYIMGENLRHILEYIHECSDYARRMKHENLALNVLILKQAIWTLCGERENFISAGSAPLHEKFIKSSNLDKASLATYYILKMQLCYLSGNYRESLLAAEQNKKNMEAIMGFMMTAEYNFYYSLAIAGAYETLSGRERKRFMKILKKNQRRMKKWSDSCPSNFLHKYLLVKAETFRITGNKQRAAELYDSAIKSSHENGYVQNNAIACELAAKFYASHNSEKIAAIYLKGAIHLYNKWGATAKAQELAFRHQDICSDINMDEEKEGKPVPDPLDMLKGILASPVFNKKSKAKAGMDIDINAIQKTMQNLSRQSDPGKFVEAFIRIAAGIVDTSKICLILQRGDELFIEVTTEGDDHPMLLVKPIPLEKSNSLPRLAVQYAARTLEPVILNNAREAGIFARDPYITNSGVQSLACIPLKFSSMPAGVLYLESTVMTGVFTREGVELLKLLADYVIHTNIIQEFLSKRATEIKSGASLYSVNFLTVREKEVLKLIAEGLSNKEIAEKLGMTVNTVKTHVKNIYGKLQVNKRVKAIEMAKKLNIL